MSFNSEQLPESCWREQIVSLQLFIFKYPADAQ